MTTITVRFALRTVAVLAALAGATMPGRANSMPLDYLWTGTFVDGPGPFNNLGFSIAFTVPDASAPDDASPSSARYFVETTLAIDGIGAFQQIATWDLNGFVATTAGLGPFTDILVPGDSMYFGICTGGSCDEPVLWNSEPFSPVLFSGIFTLGLESSCTFPGACSNAVGNYFDGAGGGFSTDYVGTLNVSAVPIPGASLLLLSALTTLGWRSRRAG